MQATKELPATSAPGFTAPSEEPVAALERELASAKSKIENLQAALATSREIGMAMGIIMARRYVTADQAFELLVNVSQKIHRKVRDIASEVVYTGKLDA